MCGWKERYGGLPVPLEWANQLTPAGLDEAPNEPGEREGGRGPGRPGGVLRARARSVPGAPSLPGRPGPPDPMLGPQLACGAHSHPRRTWLFFFFFCIGLGEWHFGATLVLRTCPQVLGQCF